MKKILCTAVLFTTLICIVSGLIVYARSTINTTSIPQQVIVTGNMVNIRSGPSVKYMKVTESYKNEKLRCIGKIGNWYIIQTSQDVIGLASGEYVKPYYPEPSNNTKASATKVPATTEKPPATPEPTITPTELPKATPTELPKVAPTEAPSPTELPKVAPTEAPSPTEAVQTPQTTLTETPDKSDSGLSIGPFKIPNILNNPATSPEATNTEAPSATLEPQNASNPSESSPSELTKDEQEMLDLINMERQKQGVAGLSIDMSVVGAARVKAQEMVDKNYFSHTSPTYGSPFDMLKTFKIDYKSAGENIAGNSTVAKAHQSLMSSSGHKKNILNANYNYVGIGIVNSPKYGKIYVQLFVGK